MTEARQTGAHAFMWCVGTALLLGGVVPLLLVEWNNSQVEVLTLLLGGGLVVLAACQLGWILYTARGDQFAVAMFWVFIYIFASLATLIQVGLDVYPMDNKVYSGDLISTGLVHLWLGVIAYLAGLAMWKALRRSADEKRGGSRQPRQPWQFSQTKTIVVGVVGLAAVGRQVYNHGVAAFFVSKEQNINLITGRGLEATGALYKLEDKTGAAFSIFATKYLVFAALFVILYSRHHGLWQRTRSKLLFDTFVVLPLIVANVIVNNPIGNGRLWFCLVLVGFSSIYLPYYKFANFRLYVVGALVILLFAFASLDAFRTTGGGEESYQSVAETLAHDPTYPVFQMHLNGVQYVQTHGHTQWQQLPGAVFSPVPRSLWPDKPIATGQVIDINVRATSLWTEGYIEFGIPGIVMLFLLLGATTAGLSAAASRATPGVLHAVFPILAVFTLILLRGSLLPAVANLYQLALAIALTVSWRRRDTKLAQLPTVRTSTRAPNRTASTASNLTKGRFADLNKESGLYSGTENHQRYDTVWLEASGTSAK